MSLHFQILKLTHMRVTKLPKNSQEDRITIQTAAQDSLTLQPQFLTAIIYAVSPATTVKQYLHCYSNM